MRELSAVLRTPDSTYRVETLQGLPVAKNTVRVFLHAKGRPERSANVLSVEMDGATVSIYCIDGVTHAAHPFALCIGTHSRTATVNGWSGDGVSWNQQAESKKQHFDVVEATIEKLTLDTSPTDG
jgi:hypothetical protein